MRSFGQKKQFLFRNQILYLKNKNKKHIEEIKKRKTNFFNRQNSFLNNYEIFNNISHSLHRNPLIKISHSIRHREPFQTSSNYFQLLKKQKLTNN